jgi:uridine kinase
MNDQTEYDMNPDSSMYQSADQAERESITRVQALLARKSRVLVAIDGNCCAGKTTLAVRLGERLSASVFHMDDYFLQPHMRTADRLNQPGGNVDAERFLADVLEPIFNGESAQLRRYDCQRDLLLPGIAVAPERVVIVEGAYSLHPLLASYYDLKLFCRVDAQEQTRRIRARNGEAMLPLFLNRWIPLENAYFDRLRIAEQCDLLIDTSI